MRREEKDAVELVGEVVAAAGSASSSPSEPYLPDPAPTSDSFLNEPMLGIEGAMRLRVGELAPLLPRCCAGGDSSSGSSAVGVSAGETSFFLFFPSANRSSMLPLRLRFLAESPPAPAADAAAPSLVCDDTVLRRERFGPSIENMPDVVEEAGVGTERTDDSDCERAMRFEEGGA